MIVGLAGVTGVGKSHFKYLLEEHFNIRDLLIATTRPRREGELQFKDKYFVDQKKFNYMVEKGIIGYYFKEFGHLYGYFKKDLESTEILTTELHYRETESFKKVCRDIITVYILPRDLSQAKYHLKNRRLDFENENYRLKEIDQHYSRIQNNKKILESYDLVVYNNYDSISEEDILSKIYDKILERS